MRIIASSADAVRVVCEACGSHRVIDRRRLGLLARCSTCDEPRVVLERRRRDTGYLPDRRQMQRSV